MKHRTLWILTAAFGLFLFSSRALAQEKRTLTLKEAIDLSIKNSKQLKGSQAKIEEATAALREAVERKLPDVNASGSYMRLNTPTVNLKLKTGGSDTTSGSSSGGSRQAKINQVAYGMVNASLPLYSG